MKFGISLHVPDNWERQLAASMGYKKDIAIILRMTLNSHSLNAIFPYGKSEKILMNYEISRFARYEIKFVP